MGFRTLWVMAGMWGSLCTRLSSSLGISFIKGFGYITVLLMQHDRLFHCWEDAVSSIWDAVNLECNFPKHLGTQVPTQASAPTELFLPEMRLCPLSAILFTFFIQLKMVLPYLRSLFIYASPSEPFICSVWHLPMLSLALLLHLHLCFSPFFIPSYWKEHIHFKHISYVYHRTGLLLWRFSSDFYGEELSVCWFLLDHT